MWDQKISTEKRDTSPPLSSIKLFETRYFLRNSKIPLRNFSAPWDKKFSTEFSDTRFLCIKFCDAQNFLKHRSVPRENFSVLCDKKFSTEKRDTPPSLMHKIFRCPKFSDTSKCSPTKFFGTVRPKILNEKSWYPPSLLHKI